jgi:hypothetical protein
MTDMIDEQSDPDPEEPRAVTVLDPEQYSQNRRLKQIYDARERVPSVLHNGHTEVRDRGTSFSEEDHRRAVAEAVCEYAIELYPLIEKSDTDLLNRQVPDSKLLIQEVIDNMGKVNGSKLFHQHGRRFDYISHEQSLWILRQLNDFMNQIGIGADLTESDNDGFLEL